MDLVRISLLPASSGEVRRLAEERVLVQLPQLPLGQRLMLARRGSSRIVGGLIEQGPEQVARVALDNPYLSETQVLKRWPKKPYQRPTVAIIARHTKWSKLVNVRVALLRHPHAPAEWVGRIRPGSSPGAKSRNCSVSRGFPPVCATVCNKKFHGEGRSDSYKFPFLANRNLTLCHTALSIHRGDIDDF